MKQNYRQSINKLLQVKNIINAQVNTMGQCRSSVRTVLVVRGVSQHFILFIVNIIISIIIFEILSHIQQCLGATVSSVLKGFAPGVHRRFYVIQRIKMVLAACKANALSQVLSLPYYNYGWKLMLKIEPMAPYIQGKHSMFKPQLSSKVSTSPYITC